MRFSDLVLAQQEIASAPPNPEAIMKLVVERAQQLTDADGAAIEMAEGDELVHRAVSGILAPQIGLRLRITASSTGVCVRSDEILRIDDVETALPADLAVYRSLGAHSVVIVPLRQQYNSVGAIKVVALDSGKFGDWEIQTLQLVTHFMAAAINQAVAFGAKQTLLAEHTRTIVALRESEARFRNAFDHAAIGMGLVALDGRWLKVNQTLCDILGYFEPELRLMTLQQQVHPDDLGNYLVRVEKLLAGEVGTFQIEMRYGHKSGATLWILLSVSMLRDGKGKPLYFIAQVQAITERKRAEEQIKNSLKEKDVLLQEIHHRVKNNLQVISSLLNLQSRYVQDELTSELFRESQNRVRSMALIHEKLYQSEDLTRIDLNEYIISLVSMLFRSYGATSGSVKLESHIDSVFLNIDTAIPVGLLLNELVSNSLKHAFPDDQGGTIGIDFRARSPDEMVLIFRDDGVGLPNEIDLDNAPTLGLRLVRILTHQIGGRLTFHRNGGTEFTITFREQKEKERK